MVKEHINKIVAVSLIITFLAFGTLFYHHVESWSYVDSFYFTGITLTTVGYGDLVPTHDSSKIVTTFFALAGVGVFLYLLTSVAASYLNRKHNLLINKKAEEKANKKLSKNIGKNLDFQVKVKKKK